jgi:hypothetical protein
VCAPAGIPCASHMPSTRAVPDADVDGDCAPELRAVGPSSGERRRGPFDCTGFETRLSTPTCRIRGFHHQIPCPTEIGTVFRGPVDRPCLREATSVYISLRSKPSVSIPHRLFLVYLGLSSVYICLPRVDYVCLPRSTTAPTSRDSLPPSAASSGVSIVLGH